jgi:hypothetical protein
LPFGLNNHSLPPGIRAKVGEESGRIFVKVQECGRLEVEHSSFSFLERRYLPEVVEEIRKFVEGGGACVFHGLLRNPGGEHRRPISIGYRFRTVTLLIKYLLNLFPSDSRLKL